eukprot:GILI01017956.1.p1 GENE.GILI01017956.1~~GILI01017956.1.p1  ORF type:complete len:190 (+),score=34.09 GILI01017956.1:145-714(+)
MSVHHQTVSEDPLLKGVTINAHVAPAGLLAPLMGHHLRCIVGKFSIDYFKDRTSGMVSLKKVICDAAHVTAIEYTDANHVDLKGKMSDADRSQISTKIKSHDYPILQASSFPSVVFDVQSETATEAVGWLTLKGRTEPLICTKTYTDTELIVRCPIIQSKWGMPRYTLLGLLTVGDQVDIEARVPRTLL